MNRKRTFNITLGGIYTALSVVSLWLASFVPGIELTLYAVSSLFTVFMISETDLKGGICVYIATSILGALIVPVKTAILPYIFFFGLYGIIKYFAEKPASGIVQLVIKLTLFLTLYCCGLFLFVELFFGTINIPHYAPWILILGGVAVFLMYDCILTLLIRIYMRRLKGGRGVRPKDIKLFNDDKYDNISKK